MHERKINREKQQPPRRNKLLTVALSLLAVSGLTTCSEESAPPVDGLRWYSDSQLSAGAGIFAENCAQCHGDEAQGLTADWREKLQDGSFPPPPLNGSAHAWHHPQSVLLQVIDNGGADLGGNMPAFADVLEHSQKLSAIAFFQSFWSDEIYQQWVTMGGNN